MNHDGSIIKYGIGVAMYPISVCGGAGTSAICLGMSASRAKDAFGCAYHNHQQDLSKNVAESNALGAVGALAAGWATFSADLLLKTFAGKLTHENFNKECFANIKLHSGIASSIMAAPLGLSALSYMLNLKNAKSFPTFVKHFSLGGACGLLSAGCFALGSRLLKDYSQQHS